MRLITLGLGAALGYLLGSAEGRKNLEKMTQNAQKLWNDPNTQEKVGQVQETAQQKFAEVKKSDPVQKATTKVEDAMQGNDKKNDVRDDRVTESNNDNVTSAASHGAEPDTVSDPSTPLGAEGPPCLRGSAVLLQDLVGRRGLHRIHLAHLGEGHHGLRAGGLGLHGE